MNTENSRRCDHCNNTLQIEGYVFRGGEAYACSDKCRDHVCADKYNTTWDEEYDDDGDSYYTEWEDSDLCHSLLEK